MKKISKPLFYLLLSLLLLLLGYKMPIAAAASIPIVANVSTNSNSPEAAVAQAWSISAPNYKRWSGAAHRG